MAAWLLVVIGVQVFGVAAPATAYEAPSSPATWDNTTGVAQVAMQSGLTAQFVPSGGPSPSATTFSSDTYLYTEGGALAGKPLNDRGYVPTDYQPVLSSSTPGVLIQTNTSKCPVSGPCAGLGTLTINFSRPVQNPVLHLAGLGGNTYKTILGDQSNFHATLKLTAAECGTGACATLPGLVDLTPPFGPPLTSNNLTVVGGDTITANDHGANTSCQTNLSGTTAANGTARAACGSVRVDGTVSSLTFALGAEAAITRGAGWMCSAYVSTSTCSTSDNDVFLITVSDHMDYGDAPTSYEQGNAGRAVLSDVRLGTCVDEDMPTTLNSTTTTDSGATAKNDQCEDGVGAFGTIDATTTSYSQVVNFGGQSKPGTVCGWIDFNNDGDYADAQERSCTTFAAGDTSTTLTWSSLSGIVPPSVAFPSYARFRIGYDATRTASPIGPSDSGEIEDYLLAPNINISKVVDAANPFDGPDADGNYTVNYIVKVDNTAGTAAGSYGALTDTPNFAGNIQWTSASWTGASSGSATAPGPFTIAPANSTVAPGAVDTYNVSTVFHYTGTSFTAADTCGGAGTGTYNVVSLPAGQESSGNTADNADCATPPFVDVRKEPAGAITGPDTSGVYHRTYTITVENLGGAAAAYGPLTDTPAFDPNLSVLGASWSTNAPGVANNPSPGTAGNGPFPLSTGSTPIAAGAAHTYNVDVAFKYNSTAPATACTGPNTGTYNAASLPGAGATTQEDGPIDNNGSCEPPTPKPFINVEKKVLPGSVVGPNSDGNYAVTYRLTVTNTGQAARFYDLQDTPQFTSNLEPIDGSWTRVGSGTTNSQGGPGPYTIAGGGVNILPGDTHEYDLTVTFKYLDQVQADDCTGSPGHGLFNSVTIPGGEHGPTTDNTACETPPPPKPFLKIKKDFGVADQPDPTVNAYTASYTVTVENAGPKATTYGELVDTPDFGDMLTVTGASWTVAGPGAPAGGTWDGTTPAGSFELAGPSTPIAGGDVHVYTVVVSYKYNSQVFASCGGPGEGTYNSVSLPLGQEDGIPDDNATCDDSPPPPASNINLKKVGGAVTGPDTDGVYHVGYDLTVTNIGPGDGSYPTIEDTPAFAPNLQVLGAKWTTDAPLVVPTPGEATGPGPYDLTSADPGSDTPIGVGETHTFHVTVDFKFLDSVPAVECDGPGTGLYNSTRFREGGGGGNNRQMPRGGFTPFGAPGQPEDGSPDDNAACVEPPADPFINITKEAGPGPVSGPNAQGEYTVDYTVKVKNTGVVPGTYGELTDTPDFADNLQVTGATWTKPGGGNGSATGAGPFTLADAGQPLAVGDEDTYVVTVTFTYTDSIPAESCGGPGTGLYNSVSLPGSQEDGPVSDNDECVEPPVDPFINIKKVAGAATQPDDDVNAYEATYTITVKNSGAADGTYGPLTDTPDFASNLQITGADWTTDAPGVTTPGSGGVGTYDLAPAGTPIAAGETHIYTLVVKFKFKNTALPADDCVPGEAGHGLFNEASIPGEDGPATDNADCKTPPDPPKSVINVKKVAGTVVGPDPDTGDFSVDYTVTVENTGPGDGAYSTLVDTPSFAPNLTPTGATWTSTGAGAAPDGTWDGTGSSFDIAPDGALIAADSEHTYHVTITFAYDNNTQAVACGGKDTGLYNHAGIVDGDTHPGELEDGSTSDNDDCVEPPAPAPPSIVLEKLASTTELNLGDTITYTFVAKNTSLVKLHDVVISEKSFSGAGSMTPIVDADCTPAPGQPATLAPASTQGGADGGTLTCTATYVVQQADVDAGVLTNTAQVDGLGPKDEEVHAEDDVVIDDPQTGSIELIKTASTNKLVKDGVITYTFVATNIGPVTLHDVKITDAVAEFSGAGVIGPLTCDLAEPVTLAPDDALTCHADYTVEQADVDAGLLHNEAHVDAKDPKDVKVEDDDVLEIPDVKTPSITLVKSASTDKLVKDGVITYTFVASNTSLVTLHDVTISELSFSGENPMGAIGNCTPGGQPATLAPASTDGGNDGGTLTCTATYVVQQADVDAGVLTNTAQVDGLGPKDEDVHAEDDVEIDDPQIGSIDLIKTASTDKLVKDGVITYTFVATNTGPVTLHDVKITDTVAEFTGAGAIGPLTCDVAEPVTLAPNDKLTCHADYTVKQADVDAGVVHNEAHVDAKDPKDVTVEDDDVEDIDDPQEGSIVLVKSASTNELVKDGVVTYTFVATNNGPVTLHDVKITDTAAAFTGAGAIGALACDLPEPVTLAPNDKLTCHADYTVKQADVDRGSIHNEAHVDAKDPKDVTVEDDGVEDIDDPKTPSIKLVKTASTNKLVKGETITYTFVASNTSLVTLHDVTISEKSFSGANPMDPIVDADCTPAPGQPARLAPASTEGGADGGTLTCTATYVVTQDDVDAGTLSNTAQVDGLGPQDQEVHAEDDVEIPDVSPPSITLVKTASTDKLVKGETITYTFVATNNGLVTLHDVVISDIAAKFTGAGQVSALTCDSAAPVRLQVGEKLTCTATYVVQQADVDAAVIDNVAVVDAKDPQDKPVTDEDDHTIKDPKGPSIEIEKTASTDSLIAGKSITYSMVATNTGAVTLKDVTIAELEFDGSGDVSALTCTPAQPSVLKPGEKMTCLADYAVSKADVQQSAITNTAGVTGTPPQGAPVTDTDDETVPGSVVRPPKPGLSFDKRVASVVDVNDNDRTDAGDQIYYEFEVANTGSVALQSVTVDDPKLANLGIAVSCPHKRLGVDESMVCKASKPYTVTKGDEADGLVHNVARVSGKAPGSTSVASAKDDTETPTGVGGSSEPALPDTGMDTSTMSAAGLGCLFLLLGIGALRRGRRRSA